MTKKKGKIVSFALIAAMLLASACFVLLGGTWAPAVATAADTSTYETVDSVYDFTFTDSSTLASRYGSQWDTYKTVVVDNANRTMKIGPDQVIDGVMEMGSYHTKFDVKFESGGWFSMFLRHNSGAGRTPGAGDYKGGLLDQGTDRGYRLFMANEYIDLKEKSGASENPVTGAMLKIDDATPFGQDKWYTFDIGVYNLTDGSVQFVIDVDGKKFTANTKSTSNSIFDEPITTGALRIQSSGTVVHFRGYDSEANKRTELFTQAHFDNWTGNGGAAGSAPMSWTSNGYQIGEFSDSKKGWPGALSNATSLVASDKTGGFSTVFKFNGTATGATASDGYNLMLAYLQPGVNDLGSGMGTSQSALVNQTWANGYIVRMSGDGNNYWFYKGVNSNTAKQVIWHGGGVNILDGKDHTIYWSVKNSPDRSFQSVILQIDDKVVIDYNSCINWTLSGTSKTVMSEEDQAKFLTGCPEGSFQVQTQAIKGTFTNVGDKDLIGNYLSTNKGVSAEDGVLTLPNGEGAQINSAYKISPTATIAFDFKADMMTGNDPKMYVKTNNPLATGNDKYQGADGEAHYYIDKGYASFMPGGADGSGMTIFDGNKHHIAISQSLSETGLTVRFFIDGVAKKAHTYTDEKFLHEGYFNIYLRWLENVEVSNLTVYDARYSEIKDIRVVGTPKAEYFVGDELELDGLTVYARYNDGTHESVAITSAMVSGYDKDTAGEQTVTVTYGGKTATFDVEVQAGDTASYRIDDSSKTVYAVNESYTEGDIKVIKTYIDNGETVNETINVTADMIEGFDASLGGEVELTVTAEEDATALKFTITVQKELASVAVDDSVSLTANIGEKFNYNALKGMLTLTYDDGTTEVKDITGDMLDMRAVTKAGVQTVTVSYEGFTDTFTVTGTSTDAWDADGDGAIRATLPEINVADTDAMGMNEFAHAKNNVVAFGPSGGQFKAFGTVDKYDAYRMDFEMMIPSNGSAQNHRMLLRASVLDNDALLGYYMVIDKGNIQVKRKIAGSTNKYGYNVAAASFSAENIGGASIYDDKWHSVSIEVFDRADDAVVINIALDGVHFIHCIDDGTLELVVWGEGAVIPEDEREQYTEAGYAGFTMNSATVWYMRSGYKQSMFEADTYLGNPNFYSADTTATVAEGKMEFTSGKAAYSYSELSSLNAEFKLKRTSSAGDGVLFAIAPMATRGTVGSLDTASGHVVKFYADRAEITLGGKVLATIEDIDFGANDTLSVVLAVNVTAGDNMISLGVNGVFVSASAAASLAGGSGYAGLYAMGDVELTAATEANRNFRILFVGNSITNHGPNKDLNYSIGTSADSWGMATDKPEYDYVHLVMSEVRKLEGYEKAEFMAINVADWERAYITYDYARYFSAGAAFEADIIIGRLGENAASSPYLNQYNFTYYYGKLLEFFNSTGKAKIILTTSYWGNENKDRDNTVDSYIVKLARDNGYPLVRLGDLGSKYKTINNASADEDYYANLPGTSPAGKTWLAEWTDWTSDVKDHPGIVGMRNIAARISESIVNYLEGGTGDVFMFERMAGLGVEYMTSSLSGTDAGAYDFARVNGINVSELADTSAYTLDTNYLVYKAFAIEKQGDVYRYEFSLDANENVGFAFKVYTVKDGEVEEVTFFMNDENSNTAVLAIDGTKVGSVLIIAVEYDKETVFRSGTLDDNRYGNLLKWLNKDNAHFVLDVSSLEYTDLTISQNMFGTIVSAGKDLEIRLTSGTVLIERKTFEVISSTQNDLFFSVAPIDFDTVLEAATATVKNISSALEFISENEGKMGEVFEAQISYNGASGDALYVNGGISIMIPVTLTAEQARKLVVITAVLPWIGDEVKNAEMLDGKLYSYSDGVLTLNMRDFDSDVMLALGGYTVELNENYKKEYTVGDTYVDGDIKISMINSVNGKVTDIDVTKAMISGFDTSKAGTITVTVSYEGNTYNATITVKEKPVENPPHEGDDEDGGCGCGGTFGLEALGSALVLIIAAAVALLAAKRRHN